jgi:aminoglycoside phosphotransferase (APT) family kinase protein
MPVAFIDWTSCRPGDRLDDLGYMAWTWCIQAEGNVPVDAQAAHLRDLRDAYGPVRPETLIDAMIRSQDRVVRHSELIRANEQTLLAALR